MCPFCVASAVLTAGSAVSGGGFAALVVKTFRAKRAWKINRLKNWLKGEKRTWLRQ
jgi:hypothetical protein